jgi:SAM-dependent methyltransferase
MSEQTLPNLDISQLRRAIQDEYAAVANDPQRGFHFHTGRYQARLVGYQESWLAGISESVIASFAGTGNPFQMGEIKPGEHVVDVGCGAGMDSLVAARMAGPEGQVVGIDMTQAMLAKALAGAVESGMGNVQFREGFAEALPVPDGWADVVISNGVLNLMPDKGAALAEMARVLRPGGRLQIGDILVQSAVPEDAKADISLWTG